MVLANFLARLNPNRRKAERARAELKENAEKALRMKQESGVGAKIPEHQTSHEGMRRDSTMAEFDRNSGREAGFTPQLKRSKVARSGDAS
ncbi:hypothetical protein [Microvirga massiliensis]|uniref:hypothetical protein n=1 Tax=Microvirga massiliensis TaxID=1033741 RepID=UPI00062B5D2F|nr:hypothetical protein [Microvirga massiliensis]